MIDIDEEAREWAEVDGCEGGDLLYVLADLYNMKHYSVFSGELEKELTAILRREIDNLRKYATADPEAHNAEEVAALVRKLYGDGEPPCEIPL